MKKIIYLLISLFIALNGMAQSFNIGINSRQFTNQFQTQNFEVGQPTNTYTPKTHTINAGLFIERVTSNSMFYRVTIGTSQSTSSTLYQNTEINYSELSKVLLSQTYNIERKAQTYNASIGVGKILSYQRLSLRLSAELYFNRCQTNSSNATGFIDPSQHSSYNTITVYTSQTPYNQYMINYYAALHYNIWKGLSIGVQIDNGITYSNQKQTVNTTTDGYGTVGTLLTTVATNNHINNQVFNTYFLQPSISIFYNLKCAKKSKKE